jgi:hypothetical protein
MSKWKIIFNGLDAIVYKYKNYNIMVCYTMKRRIISIQHYHVYHYEFSKSFRYLKNGIPYFSKTKQINEDGTFETMRELNRFLKQNHLPRITIQHIAKGFEE